MIFLLALFGFFLFTLIFCLVSGSIIYHINAYTLPGWTVGRTVIIVFLALSLLLFIFAGYSFSQIPWNDFAPSTYKTMY